MKTSNLSEQLMRITYDIIKLEKEKKFINEINSIAVKPDLKPLPKLDKTIKKKYNDMNIILDKMKDEKEKQK